MFLNNKYTRWYYEITNSSMISMRSKKDGIYYESHHVIPKSIGGPDTISNKVLLTFKEHFLCHWLLTKMVSDPKHLIKMNNAFFRMTHVSKNQNRTVTSRQIAVARRKFAQSRTGAGNPQFNKPGTMRGRKHSTEARAKMSISQTGKIRGPLSQTQKDQIRDRNSKAVLCVTNGVTYPSQTAAAKALGLRQGDINNVLGKRQKSTGGHTFKYVQ